MPPLKRPVIAGALLYACLIAGWGVRSLSSRPVRGPWLPARARLAGRVISPVTENRQGSKCFVEAQRLEGRPFAGKVLVHLPRDAAARSLRPGQRVAIEGRLRPARRARNPGEFDERAFLWSRGAAWVLHGRSLEVAAVSEGRWRVRAWAESLRRSLEAAWRSRLSATAARVMTGICLGYKAPLPAEVEAAIQDSGTMHLLVPSGAKVAFVLAAGELALKNVLFPAWRYGIIGTVVGFYVLLLGADAPYVRAYLCWLILRFAHILGREPGFIHILALSALLILAWDPRELFTAGFQMTYLAAGVLTLAMPRLSRALPRRWPNILRGSVSVLAGTVLVTAALWPTFAAYFGRGAVVGALANIPLIPYSGVLMGAGFGLWFADFAGGGVAVAAVVERLLGWFLEACAFFAAFPGAAVDLTPMTKPEIAAYYGALAAALAVPRWRVSAALLGLAAAVWLIPQWRERDRLSVLLMRLPGGRAALASFPGGERWLIDAGGPAGALRRALSARRVLRLDRLIVTGTDADRWRGLERLLRRVPVERIEVPPGPLPAGLERALRAQGGRVRRWSGQPPLVARGDIVFDFRPPFPRVLRGEGEYSIIPSLLKVGAVEVLTDGVHAKIISPF